MGNIFVIGDLVIDHTVFVKKPSGHRRGIKGEPIYEVVSRIDTAGGAATCARALAVLNPGLTFLWGMVGESNWGNFRSILANCHAFDGAQRPVEFRGVHDETHAQMNTITRLVLVQGAPLNFDDPSFESRFDDYGHVHVSDNKRESVVHYLERAQAKLREKLEKIDAIVINDLDMNCLTLDTAKRIAAFANATDPPTPLFVDPKRERGKYSDIEGTAIIPNLAEWCHLVSDKDQQQEETTWRAALDRPEALEQMAQLSFKYFGNFRYHIITCGHSGAVIMAPHPDKSDCYAVYRVPPHETRKPAPPPQLGCGDIITAVFAMEYADSPVRDTEAVLRAFQRANAVVACYRDMPWQRMPPPYAVAEAQRQPTEPRMLFEPSKGMLFLPKERTVKMFEHETAAPDLYSFDSAYTDKVKAIIDDTQNSWKGGLRSVIIGAPSGSGKTSIIDAIREFGKQAGITVRDFPGIKNVSWDNLDGYFTRLSKGARKGRVLIVMDEALKGDDQVKHLNDYGMVMLDAAHAHNVRFVFVDVRFRPDEQPLLDDRRLTSEFTSRCRPYYLSGLSERPFDIPLIVAGVIFNRDRARTFNSLKVGGRFLLTIINATLSSPNTRVLCEWVEKAYEAAHADWDDKDQQFTLKFSHLPEAVRGSRRLPNIDLGSYEFRRAR
jgi:sugar/nucleoside kinase (ribokinase family)